MHSALTSGIVKALNAWTDLYLALHPLKRAVSAFSVSAV